MSKKAAKSHHKEEEQQEELPTPWNPQPEPELEPKQQTPEEIEAQQSAEDGPGRIEGFGYPELHLRPGTDMEAPGPVEPEEEGTEPPPEGRDVKTKGN